MDYRKILNDFLPDKLFDAHAHPYDSSFLTACYPPERKPERFDLEDYRRDMKAILGFERDFMLNMIPFPDKKMADLSNGSLAACDAFSREQLELDKRNVGELLVLCDESAEHIASRLGHPQIRGLKCYHYMNPAEKTFGLDIGEYLPEGAWEVANEKHMFITLHMVKQDALADEANLKYIRSMAKKYPDAVLILAHAARSFASWTGVENVDKIADLDNVWFDFGAVCESPAILRIMQKTGTKRCMWGSDYPISNWIGKAISLGNGFYWIYEDGMERLGDVDALMPERWTVAVECFMAVRQACILADLSEDAVEDVFYNNADNLFHHICG